jgi:hypothetical protein
MKEHVRLGRSGLLGERGAVVFGHSVSWKWRWREHCGDRGQDLEAATELPEESHQEVSGPSNSSSESRGGTDSPSTTRRFQSRRGGEQTSATSLDVTPGVGSSQSSRSGYGEPSSSRSRGKKRYRDEGQDWHSHGQCEWRRRRY